jgi:hypothetical protein
MDVISECQENRNIRCKTSGHYKVFKRLAMYTYPSAPPPSVCNPGFLCDDTVSVS